MNPRFSLWCQTWSLLSLAISCTVLQRIRELDKMQSIMNAHFCELMPSIVRMILSFNSSSNLFFCDFVLKGIGEEKETSNNHRNADEVSVNVLKGYSLEFRFVLFFCYIKQKTVKKQTFQTFAESCTAPMARPVRKNEVLLSALSTS